MKISIDINLAKENKVDSVQVGSGISRESAEESGHYVPIDENGEADFTDKEYFKHGDKFPDQRDWILCLIKENS